MTYYRKNRRNDTQNLTKEFDMAIEGAEKALEVLEEDFDKGLVKSKRFDFR